MNRLSMLALVAVAAAAALAWLLWWVVAPPPAGPPGDRPASGPVPVAAGGAGVAALDPGHTNGQRQEVDPQLSRTGSLLLHAIWGDDGTAAADVPLWLHASGGDPLFAVQPGRTDAGGELRFAALQPGKYYVTAGRGGLDPPTVAEVEAGRQSVTEVELQPGIAVVGLVVGPDDLPLVAAEVVVSPWDGSELSTLASTDATGRFRLRAVGTHCSVGARANGFQPSPMQVLTAEVGAEVEVRIVVPAGGGALHGRVLDRRDRPVASAIVRVGKPRDGMMLALPNGVNGLAQTPLQTRTDAAGDFALPCLWPGEQPVQVRAQGLAPWRGLVQVTVGRDEELVVRLQDGVTLRGSVRDDGNAPVAGAEVLVGDRDDLACQSQATAGDGSFELHGLPAGELRLRVESEGHGKAETRLQAAAGETLRWDAVLSRGLCWRGIVLDADGEPVARAVVDAWRPLTAAGAQWGAHERSGDDGRFELQNCVPGEPIHVTVRRRGSFPELRLEHLLPGPDELVLRLPPEAWVRIRGKVVGPDGAAVANASIYPANRIGSSSPVETADATTGAFDLGPYPAGEYALVVEAAGCVRVRLPWRRLAKDEVWDTGTLQLERGGSLLAMLQAATPALPAALRLSVLDSDGTFLQRVELRDLVGRAGPLHSGSYLLQVRGIDVACAELPFTVRDGGETLLDVPLHPCVAVDFEFAVADQKADRLRVEVRDATRQPVLRTDVWRRPDGFLLTAGFLPGDYELEASSRGGEHGTASITVGADGRARVEVELKK